MSIFSSEVDFFSEIQHVSLLFPELYRLIKGPNLTFQDSKCKFGYLGDCYLNNFTHSSKGQWVGTVDYCIQEESLLPFKNLSGQPFSQE